MESSELKMYSYGVVAANKSPQSNEIQVTPVEKVPMNNGELTDNLDSRNVKGEDADGATFEATVRSANTLTARWLPFGSNRKTSPDVRRGEKVCIWKFADADKYYWSELEYDPKLRKLETVIWAFSNTKSEGDDATEDTTYFLEISTHTKTVHFHTSTSDGEPYGYDFVLNTKDGIFQFFDTIQNAFFMDSAAKRLVLKNASDCSFDMSDKDLNVTVPGDCNWKIGGKFQMIADGGWYAKAPESQFITPKLITTEVFQAGTDAIVGGNLTLGGGMKSGVSGGAGSGTIQLNGEIQATQGASFSGTVNAIAFKGDGSQLTGVSH